MFGSSKRDNNKSKQSSSKSTKITTLIGQQTELRGDIVYTGGLHIDGTVKGNIFAAPDSGSTLSLSDRGVVEGEVRVPHVVLNGNVVGDVHATDYIELKSQARVHGNVYYNLMEMERGAKVNGNLVDTSEEDDRAEHGHRDEHDEA